jgi:hypothetical protein
MVPGGREKRERKRGYKRCGGILAFYRKFD